VLAQDILSKIVILDFIHIQQITLKRELFQVRACGVCLCHDLTVSLPLSVFICVMYISKALAMKCNHVPNENIPQRSKLMGLFVHL
jgi:hypothetical protein